MRSVTLIVIVLALVAAACGRGDEPVVREPPTGEPATGEPAPDPTGSPAPRSPTPEAEPGSGDPADAVTGERWSAVSEAPQELTEVSAAALGGMLLVAGGLDAGGEAVAGTLLYDPVFARWASGPSLPAAVHHTALVSTGTDVLQIGGYLGAGFAAPQAAVNRFDPADGVWEAAPPLPEPRAAGAAAWDGERVVYAGGVGPAGLAGEVYALDPAVGEWALLGTLSEPREHLAAASDGQGRVWFLGGRTAGLDTNLATVDLVTGSDVSVLGELPTARGGLAGFYHPAAGACAAGGEGPLATFAEVECVDADGTVTTLPALSTPRHGIGAAVAEGIAYVLLGGPEPRLTVSSTVEALRLD